MIRKLPTRFSIASVISLASAALSITAIAAEWEYGKESEWIQLGDEKFQSPIELEVAGGDAKLPGTYGKQEAANVENNGHTFQLNYAKDGGVLEKDGKAYKLVQFHFHSPSEHAQVGYPGWTDENGKQYPGHYGMEVHFVHTDGSFTGNGAEAAERPDLLVVGVFIKEGEENPALAKVWAEAPAGKDKDVDLAFEGFDASSLMPKGGSYRTYTGSLTTPPASSGVSWIVMDMPIEASREQIEKLREAMHHNTNRSLQDLAGREPAPASAN